MSKISVIIPIYNAERYLLRTVGCLKKQSFTDFEVLLIDDGSSDNSAAILQKAASEDSRFKYVYQENQGVSSARNHGLELCKGEYVTFLDADDIFPENYLEALLCALEDNACQMSICDVTVLENSRETKRFACTAGHLTQKEALDLLLSRKQINSGPCGKLFCREFVTGLRFPPLKVYEDILFVMDALCRCEAVASTSKTEYGYIQNEGSAMSTAKNVPNKDVITATEQILTFLKERNDLSPVCTYTTLSHLMQYVQPLIGQDNERARDFVKAAQGVYRRNKKEIRLCAAFPRKEKIAYLLFARGWSYQNKRITRVR